VARIKIVCGNERGAQISNNQRGDGRFSRTTWTVERNDDRAAATNPQPVYRLDDRVDGNARG